MSEFETRQLQEQLQSVQDMYIKDTEEMRDEISKLRTEREQWKNRALEAEASSAEAKRNLRHI